MGKTGDLAQNDFAGRDDTQALNTDTYSETKSTNWTQTAGEVFRCRFLIEETNNVAITIATKAQYNLASGGWNDVTATSPIQWAASSQYADDDSITGAHLTPVGGSGGFQNGYGSESDNIAPDSGSVSLPALGYTEFEYAFYVDPAQVSNDQTFQLRLTQSDGTDLTAWNAVPTITITGVPEAARAYPRSAVVINPGSMINWGHPFTKGLIACYVFNERGETVFDYTRKGHNGAFTGGLADADRSPGEFGPGIQFGGAGEYVSVPNHPNWNSWTQHAVFGVISGVGAQSVFGRLCVKPNATTGLNWAVEISSSSGQLRYLVNTVSDATALVAFGPDLRNDASTHSFYCEWQGDTPQMRTFFDGAFSAQDSLANGTMEGDTVAFGIGRHPAASSSEYDGKLHVLYIWDRHFSASSADPRIAVELHKDPYQIFLGRSLIMTIPIFAMMGGGGVVVGRMPLQVGMSSGA